MITTETLLEKKRQIQEAIAQLQANLNAHQGALQMVEALLRELEEAPHEPTEKPVV